MNFLFGALFKKQFDSLIRNKDLYILSGILYLIFISFIVADFFTAGQAENYHRSARILFPAEFTKRLILYELIAFICVMPFFSVFAFTITDEGKLDLWALPAGYNHYSIILQKLMPIIIFCFDSLFSLTVISLISTAYFRDCIYRTVLTAQGIIGLIIVLYVCITALLCVCIRRKEAVLLATVAVAVLCIANMHLIGSWVEMLSEPRSLINAMLAINPMTLVSGILGYDIMRSWFLYNTSQAVMFRFDYAGAGTTAIICTLLSIALYLLTCQIWKFKTSAMLYKKWRSDTLKSDFPIIDPQPPENRGSVTALIAPDEKSLETCIFPICSKFSGVAQNTSLFKKRLIKIGFAIAPVFYGFDRIDSYLAFFANLYRVPWQERRQRISQTLTLCGLQDISHKKTADLSLSEKAILSIARSLIHNPAYIIWHQVLPFMSERHRRIALDLAHNLSRNGITLVITATVADICFEPEVDHILAVKNGTFVINSSQSELSEKMLESFWE